MTIFTSHPSIGSPPESRTCTSRLCPMLPSNQNWLSNVRGHRRAPSSLWQFAQPRLVFRVKQLNGIASFFNSSLFENTNITIPSVISIPAATQAQGRVDDRALTCEEG